MATRDSNHRLRRILAGFMVPLARTLLRCGLNYSDFADIAKRAFVHAATVDYGVRNRPTSIARVAVMTGLSRREVSKLRDDLKGGVMAPASSRNLPAEILERWHTDPLYLDANGQPKALAYSSGKVSFVTLVRSVTTDIPPKALEKELIRAGSLRLGLGRKVVPATREFVPKDWHEKSLEGLQYGLRRLAETISHNSDPRNEGQPWFQRVIHTGNIPESVIPELRDSLGGIMGNFSMRVDDHIGSFQGRQKRTRIPSGQKTVGIGVYYFEGDSD